MSALPCVTPAYLRVCRNGAGWTQARVETMKTLQAQGLSARQIARELGGVTRNAVIGKLHRLGIQAHPRPSTPAAPRQPRLQRPSRPRLITRAAPAKPLAEQTRTLKTVRIVGGRVQAAVTAAPLPVLREIIPQHDAKPWLERQIGECAWPVSGDGAETMSCCAPVGHDSPSYQYCREHLALLSVPARRHRPSTVDPLEYLARRFG